MDSVAVTVVIPTHNRPALMQRALESVLDQKYSGEIEVIVVFDACDPFLPPVVIPQSRSVRILVNQRTRGLAGARNTGIDAASHDYVAFLDDDDHWLPDKLDEQMPRFADPTRPILVGSAMVLDDGARTFERLVPTELVGYEDLLKDRMAGLHSSTFVFHRDALIEIGMVDERLPGSYGEDYDLLLRTARCAPVVVVNQPLVTVTWSGQSFYFGRWGAYAEGLAYLYAHHGFDKDRRASGRIAAQIAFARAANAERRSARRWVRHALRKDPMQVKAWLALGISLRLISAPWVIRTLQRVGKGI